MADHGRWATGERQIQAYLDQGRLQAVEPSADHARLLLDQAEVHLTTAGLIVTHDPVGAFAMLYDASRKSMVAVLARQGLRPTAKGGHRVVQDALEAQLGPSGRRTIRRFRALRLRRHDSEYPEIDSQPVTVEQAQEGLGDAREIVTAMRRVVDSFGPWDDSSS